MSFSAIVLLALAAIIFVVLARLELSGKGSLDNPSPAGCFLVLAILICLIGAFIYW